MPGSKQQSVFSTSTYLGDRQNGQLPEDSTTQDNAARSRLPENIFSPPPNNSDNSAIIRYLRDDGDSLLPQHLAIQSRLLSPATVRVHRPKATTSMLLSGNSSLAALTTASSVSSAPSVSSSLGIRYLGPSRILEHDHQGALHIAPLPHQVVFECPFNFLYCLCTFTSLPEWFSHSLTHFKRVTPPPTNICCFCDVIFEASDGMKSWRDKIEHTGIHHQLGHKLAHARPEFGLYNYLWKTRLIESSEYKDLMAGHQASGSSLPTPERYLNVTYTATQGPRRDRRRPVH